MLTPYPNQKAGGNSRTCPNSKEMRRGSKLMNCSQAEPPRAELRGRQPGAGRRRTRARPVTRRRRGTGRTTRVPLRGRERRPERPRGGRRRPTPGRAGAGATGPPRGRAAARRRAATAVEARRQGWKRAAGGRAGPERRRGAPPGERRGRTAPTRRRSTTRINTFHVTADGCTIYYTTIAPCRESSTYTRNHYEKILCLK